MPAVPAPARGRPFWCACISLSLSLLLRSRNSRLTIPCPLPRERSRRTGTRRGPPVFVAVSHARPFAGPSVPAAVLPCSKCMHVPRGLLLKPPSRLVPEYPVLPKAAAAPRRHEANLPHPHSPQARRRSRRRRRQMARICFPCPWRASRPPLRLPDSPTPRAPGSPSARAPDASLQPCHLHLLTTRLPCLDEHGAVRSAGAEMLLGRCSRPQ